MPQARHDGQRGRPIPLAGRLLQSYPGHGRRAQAPLAQLALNPLQPTRKPYLGQHRRERLVEPRAGPMTKDQLVQIRPRLGSPPGELVLRQAVEQRVRAGRGQRPQPPQGLVHRRHILRLAPGAHPHAQSLARGGRLGGPFGCERERRLRLTGGEQMQHRHLAAKRIVLGVGGDQRERVRRATGRHAGFHHRLIEPTGVGALHVVAGLIGQNATGFATKIDQLFGAIALFHHRQGGRQINSARVTVTQSDPQYLLALRTQSQRQIDAGHVEPGLGVGRISVQAQSQQTKALAKLPLPQAIASQLRKSFATQPLELRPTMRRHQIEVGDAIMRIGRLQPLQQDRRPHEVGQKQGPCAPGQQPPRA